MTIPLALAFLAGLAGGRLANLGVLLAGSGLIAAVGAARSLVAPDPAWWTALLAAAAVATFHVGFCAGAATTIVGGGRKPDPKPDPEAGGA